MNDSYDVLVVGGGTAGAIAAISASRCGLKTLVTETLSALGGTQTFGLVMPYMSPGLKDEKFINSAIGAEIQEEMIRRGYGRELWFDPNMLKVVLEEKVLEAGAEILYETSVIDVKRRDKKIREAVIYNSDGIGALSAKMYLDCTGDADVAKMSGVEVMSGNRDGVNQSSSLRFEMANVDWDSFAGYLKKTGQDWGVEAPFIQTCTVNAECSQDFIMRTRRAKDEGRLNDREISHIQLFSVPGCPGTINFNCPETGAGKRISSAKERTERLIAGRKSVLRIAAFMRSDIPGFENAYISQIAPMLGIRESERIYAEYEYSIQDVAQRRRFEDAVFKSAYPIDVHGGSAEIGEEVDYVPCVPEEDYFEYPYRGMVPRGVDNLLVCGRCTGCDFMTQSALRVQFSCQAMGEAAGIAAKIALEENLRFADVDGRKVRQKMRERGSMI